MLGPSESERLQAAEQQQRAAAAGGSLACLPVMKNVKHFIKRLTQNELAGL